MPYDFANILFSGRCNLRCPYCIGHNSALRQMPDNLRMFPLAGLEPFIEMLRARNVRQISLTGTNTDPQLYACEADLIAYLRKHLPNVQLSLHSNGHLALKKIHIFNLYDRATISCPSFKPGTYRALTGGASPPDLPAIVEAARIPLKISTILTTQNIREIPDIIEHCRQLHISRLVLRQQYGDTNHWPLFIDHTPRRYFGGNPVYEIDGVEVTVWNFSNSVAQCLNLFSDGTISADYQIARQDSMNEYTLALKAQVDTHDMVQAT